MDWKETFHRQLNKTIKCTRFRVFWNSREGDSEDEGPEWEGHLIFIVYSWYY